MEDPRDCRIGELEAEVVALRAQVAELAALVLDLRARLKSDSRTSSKPPSSDGLAKKPRPAVPRIPGERPPGKQSGAAGHHLSPVDDPDEVIEHVPTACEGCGDSLTDADDIGVECRQVGDLPPIALKWIEHRAHSRRCTCGHVTKASFPIGVTAPVQYGPGVQAVSVYLHAYQHQPFDRVRQTLHDILGAEVSHGWVVSAFVKIASVIEPVACAIADAIAGSDLAHFDETGARVAGRLHWVHVAATGMLTHYALHTRRGQVAMKEIGIIPRFVGIGVHDGLSGYRQFEHITHALCNAHHLRELAAIGELFNQPWANDMAELLLKIKDKVERTIERGKPNLSQAQLRRYRTRYKKIVTAGQAANPPPLPTGKRGRPKLGKAGSLVKRLNEYIDDVLRFMYDFTVPFDNNQAERDIRMVKLQQKTSGCWRTQHGASNYLNIRAYVATARKQGKSVIEALHEAARGTPWQPAGT